MTGSARPRRAADARSSRIRVLSAFFGLFIATEAEANEWSR